MVVPPAAPPAPPARFAVDFPVTLERLKEIYAGANIVFEHHRFSFDELFVPDLQAASLAALIPRLAEPGPPPRAGARLIQRHFYWSAACFYRSYYLFLGYLVLERKPMHSWGHVTAYYSRFYFIQALANLFLSNIVHLNLEDALGARIPLADPQDSKFLVYCGMGGVRAVRLRDLHRGGWPGGSHQIWWRLLQEFKHVGDMPRFDGSEFALSDAYYNPASRNEINYSDQYLDAFTELEWFDTNQAQMFAHMNVWSPRQDRDITSIDAFFDGEDPAEVEAGDFYGDDIQILWLGLRLYLEVLRALEIQQPFITAEKLRALNDRFIRDEYPSLTRGLDNAIGGILA